jgi:hypothetical protein
MSIFSAHGNLKQRKSALKRLTRVAEIVRASFAKEDSGVDRHSFLCRLGNLTRTICLATQTRRFLKLIKSFRVLFQDGDIHKNHFLASGSEF